jgi:exodeoxyribonuclease VII large subunit
MAKDRDQLTFGSLEPPWPGDDDYPAPQRKAEVVRPGLPKPSTEPAPTPVVSPPAPVGPRRYGVGELVREAQRVVEARFPSVWVEGELSNVRQPTSGHYYFTLKDALGQLAAVLFRGQARHLRFEPKDGLKVLCRGRLSIYDAQGKFQLNVDEMRLAGAGELQLRFEQLKEKLAAEGLFDEKRKRRLPFLPRRIGVVTSPTGAALRDLVRVVHRRYPARLLISPAAVQGAEAPGELCRALRALFKVPDVDVIVLCRGGGSVEDLWAFNDEGLARLIARSPVPIVSAVGHETDFTIADFVADLRAPTPSAAGERVVPVLADLVAEHAALRARLERGVRRSLRDHRLAREALLRRIGDPRRRLDQLRQRLDDLVGRAESLLHRRIARQRDQLRALEGRLLQLHPKARLGRARGELLRLDTALFAAMRRTLEQRRGLFRSALARLEALSPLGILARGYALARLAPSEGGPPERQVIVDAAQAPPGTRVDVRLARGELRCRVEEVLPPEPLLTKPKV